MEHIINIHTMGHGYTLGWKNDHRVLLDRLYIIHGGEGSYSVGDKTYPFLPGHSYYLPWTENYTLSQNPDKPMDHTFVDFSGSASLLSIGITDISPSDEPRFLPILTMMESMIDLCSVEEDPGFYLVNDNEHCCPNVMHASILQLLELITLTYGAYQFNAPDIHRVLAYIHAHYKEPLTVNDLAAIACLNPRYFIAKFTEVVHITPSRYLHDLRCNIAMSLIDHGVPLSRAAEETGFPSASALYRMIRNHRKT